MSRSNAFSKDFRLSPEYLRSVYIYIYNYNYICGKLIPYVQINNIYKYIYYISKDVYIYIPEREREEKKKERKKERGKKSSSDFHPDIVSDIPSGRIY